MTDLFQAIGNVADRDVWLMIFGSVIAAAVAALISWTFAREQARKSRHYTTLLVKAIDTLESGPTIAPRHDTSGELVGLDKHSGPVHDPLRVPIEIGTEIERKSSRN